jgi:hypothetical protein
VLVERVFFVGVGCDGTHCYWVFVEEDHGGRFLGVCMRFVVACDGW